MVDISIIVAAYNIEDYLEKCLDSLVNQTKKNIEIIVINDGSKDRSKEIAEDFQKKFPDMVKVISKENGGLSNARNDGIKIAKGKYIAFVDGDDYVTEDMYEKLYEKAIEKDYDIVTSNANCVYPNKNVEIPAGIDKNYEKLSKEEKNNLLLNLYVPVWNKIYKKEIFSDKDLLFEPNIWFEDVLFLYKLIPHLNSIGYVDDCFYQYIQRENSITYTYSDKLTNINLVMEKILEYYKKKGFYDEYKNELEYIYVRYMFATYIKRLSKAKDKKRFKQGVEFAIECVNKNFPNYKKNIYLNQRKCFKNIYLKNFNKLLAKMVYCAEKNKMN